MADYVEARLWCSRCRSYGVDGSNSTVCPCCLDDDRRLTQAVRPPIPGTHGDRVSEISGPQRDG